MSVETLAIVLHHSKARGTAKLVLIGIANHEGDGGAWPSVATLAVYANVDERSVQRALDKLVGSGELRRDVQAGGTHATEDHRRPNRYTVQVACPPWCDRTANHRDTRRRSGPQLGLLDQVRKLSTRVTPVSPHLSTGVTPVSPGGVTPVSPEPSLEPAAKQVVPQSLDRRACQTCGVDEERCQRVQLAWPREDRHPYRPVVHDAQG